ncbi:uncharacterized protein BJ171DRAFT_489173 [Polychytrium aggregatum]|uniref:uncharacterized protein n=1 Tax=Polychytrium aggregatum TaxID=110093 RepID=UPI0022FEEFC9|nr:uncharacterized protein BJ171DRAFT_489173 [Polychytrium aggregatum]KAI9208517.1 hypothetical protein BJ171DRAFT_489173 [Polychytrium aggregatum]
MPTATWNGVVIAQSDQFETVEGNIYFPVDSLDKQYIKPSTTQTVCSWKGVASYYTLVVKGKENPDAVWFYADPKPAAKNIAGHVAFWKGVTVTP